MLICRQGNIHIGNRTDDAVATRRSHTWGKSYFLWNFVYISWFNWNVFSLCVQLQLVNLVAFQRRDKSIPRKPPLYLPTTRDFLETCKCHFWKKKTIIIKIPWKEVYMHLICYISFHSQVIPGERKITDRLMIYSEHF